MGQLFSTDLRSKIKNAESLRFIIIFFRAKTVLWSGGKTFTPYAARTINFQRKNINYFNSLFHSVYLGFSIRLISIAYLFAVRYLWDVCNEDNCWVVTHFSRVAWPVYFRTYCVPIATFNLDYFIWATPK